MEWSDLPIFLEAVRSGSYTAAAQVLNCNRTTVGRRVEALEKALQISLFRETPAGPEPTSEGQVVLDAALQIEAQIGELRQRLSLGGSRPERIRIASSAAIATEFLGEIAEFQRDHPGTTIELLSEIDPLDAVGRRRADLAVALTRAPPQRLTGVSIGPVDQALYQCGTGAQDRLLLWGQEAEALLPRHWAAANLSSPDLSSIAEARFNGWPELRQAVAAGLGRAYLCCFVADMEPSLTRIGPPETRWRTEMWLLRRAAAPPSPAIIELIEFLQARLGRRLMAGSAA